MKSFHQLMEEKKKEAEPQPPRPKKRIVSLEEYKRLMKLLDGK